MRETNAAPLFPRPVVFPDVDAAVLAREEGVAAVSPKGAVSGAWQSYLRRTLPLPQAGESVRSAS
jgi:hypothetical protein